MRICSSSILWFTSRLQNRLLYSITPHAQSIFSSSSQKAACSAESSLSLSEFLRASDELLRHLTDRFELLPEEISLSKDYDTNFFDGVLTINFGRGIGIYVINRQTPNRQIWLSSPKSGPKRFDYCTDSKNWICKRDFIKLSQLLEDEIFQIVGSRVFFGSK
ncbi:unnamed protein product [Protopolystoma xenopodis]|uniref:ferroxidase n=1 Tax=Protopolystoma xenopodis TaxID=117903 RepID=A0A448XN62_9PLAT|nr:unnamed protein product [Protopolystoma xenopodis]